MEKARLEFHSGPYEERLHDALEAPLFWREEIIDYDQVQTIDDATPTPLDPSNVFVFKGMDTQCSYVQFAHTETMRRLDVVNDRLDLPDGTYNRIADELCIQLEIRCSRNADSMARLKNAIYGHKVDDELIEIIKRARKGTAEPEEIIRLIKEYPDMISAEMYKVTKPFDPQSLGFIENQINDRIMMLSDTFESAEVTQIDSRATGKSTSFLDENGAYIEKDVILELKSRDSHTEIIRKKTGIMLPPQLQLPGVERNYRKIPRVDSKEWELVDVQPISVSYYARAADYKTRAGYERESISAPSKSIDADSLMDDDIASVIADPDMREAYYQAAMATQKRMARTAIDSSDK